MSSATKTLDALPTRNEEGAWLAVIEASQGSRHKLKYTREWNAFVLDGVLPVGLAFAYDFGFLPSTLGDDGDPLDVLVLADESLPPGSVVPCRIARVVTGAATFATALGVVVFAMFVLMWFVFPQWRAARKHATKR